MMEFEERAELISKVKSNNKQIKKLSLANEIKCKEIELNDITITALFHETNKIQSKLMREKFGQ